MNVLILMGGGSQFFDIKEYIFPKPLIEILGKPMIQWTLKKFLQMDESIKFTFVVNEKDCRKFHLDKVLNLLTNNNCNIVRLEGETRGAACSALLAISHINNDEELIIASDDQYLDVGVDSFISSFRKANADVGVVTFESVHPKWSFVRLDKNDNIIELAEKRPISNNAIAGVFYFKKGRDFVYAAMESIKKNANVDNIFFIAPSINELVLANKCLVTYPIDSTNYYKLYSPQKIQEFEQAFQDKFQALDKTR